MSLAHTERCYSATIGGRVVLPPSKMRHHGKKFRWLSISRSREQGCAQSPPPYRGIEPLKRTARGRVWSMWEKQNINMRREGESGICLTSARAFVVAVVLFGEAIAGAAPIVLPLPP